MKNKTPTEHEDAHQSVMLGWKIILAVIISLSLFFYGFYLIFSGFYKWVNLKSENRKTSNYETENIKTFPPTNDQAVYDCVKIKKDQALYTCIKRKEDLKIEPCPKELVGSDGNCLDKKG